MAPMSNQTSILGHVKTQRKKQEGTPEFQFDGPPTMEKPHLGLDELSTAVQTKVKAITKCSSALILNSKLEKKIKEA